MLYFGLSMPFSQIIGHERQAAYFAKVLAQNTVAHAYMLSGPAGVGKRAVVERLAALMLQVDPAKLGMHPDVIVVARPTDDKTGERKRQIPIELIRAACDRLAMSAVTGLKVVIIEDADTLTVQAQNALLKTLEEPSGKALMFLLAQDPARLLATIRSRTVPIALSQVPTAQIAAALKERGYAPAIAEEAAARALGCPGAALALADADILMETRQEYAAAQDFVAAPRHKRVQLIAGLVKGDDAQSHDGRQAWLLRVCEVLHAQLHDASGPDANTVAALSSLLAAREAIRDNANTALALERVALALS